MNQDTVQKVADWMEYVLRRTNGETSTTARWSQALARVVVPLAAQGVEASLCYWALIGYCRLHDCRLPSEWPGAMADAFDKLLKRVKTRTADGFEPTQLLGCTVNLLLELSVEFAGRNPREWDAHLLAYT